MRGADPYTGRRGGGDMWRPVKITGRVGDAWVFAAATLRAVATISAETSLSLLSYSRRRHHCHRCNRGRGHGRRHNAHTMVGARSAAATVAVITETISHINDARRDDDECPQLKT